MPAAAAGAQVGLRGTAGKVRLHLVAYLLGELDVGMDAVEEAAAAVGNTLGQVEPHGVGHPRGVEHSGHVRAVVDGAVVAVGVAVRPMETRPRTVGSAGRNPQWRWTRRMAEARSLT
ncbi:hypothetical protein GCM10027162_28260 [Streptomyces incanus]